MEDNVYEMITRCIDIYNKRNPHKPFPPYVKVTFDLKGRTAGQACYPNKIRINQYLLEQYGQKYIDDTVVHEIAHLLTDHKYPHSKPHGDKWQQIMFLLGVTNPSTTHSYSTKPARQTKQYVYICDCRVHYLPTITHNRILKGAEYKCKRCGTGLVKTV